MSKWKILVHNPYIIFCTNNASVKLFKGLDSEKIDEEVQRMLLELYLTDKADNIAKTLSGGQKRKLSVGIAVIGNPKIIILDEPTAGVDPPARRHLWSLLQKRKKGKVLL